MSDRPQAALSSAQIDELDEGRFQHPLNANSEVFIRSLSEAVGMRQVGVHLARVPPGKESFAYHTHHYEEEFLYILSGRGVADIDGREVEVGPGDFLGFKAPSVGHQLRNPFDDDLVYLMGGERREYEIADFPRLRKRLIRDRDKAYFVHVADLDEFDLSEVKD
jgi:uncharacterized cupin superfamily protein